jgi:ribonuclease HII
MVGAYVYDLQSKPIRGVNDSKQLKADKRNAIYQKLIKTEYKLTSADNKLIDKLGVGRTIESLIGQIIAGFAADTFFLIDGYFANNWGIPERLKLIKKGDARHYSIAAGSIIAKVTRDLEMTRLASLYPGYAFESNFGYGTSVHREKLIGLGVSEIHRRSYAPIAQLLEQFKLI